MESGGYWTNMSEPFRKWQTAVTGKGKCLSRSRGHGADGDHDKKNEDDNGHSRGSSSGIGCVLEDVDEREASWRSNGISDVANAEQICDQKAKGEGYIEQECPDHALWDDKAGIFDFFGHMGDGIRACFRVSCWSRGDCSKASSRVLTKDDKHSAHLTDQCGPSDVWPATTIVRECSEDSRGRLLWRHYQKDNDDREEAKDVEGDEYSFCERKMFCCKDVEHANTND